MREGQNNGVHGFVLLGSFAIVAGLLYFAKAVVIPIAVATLFAFLLSPLVARLQRWRLPKVVAVIITATLGFVVVAFIAWLVTTQLIALAEELPKYEQNLHAKMRNLRGVQMASGPFSRAADMVKGLLRDFEQSTAPPENTASAPGTPERPVTVEVKAPKPTMWQLVRTGVGPMLAPLGHAGMVVLLVFAMLLKSEDMRDRFIKVVSRGQLNVATEAINDAANRISRYLLMLLLVNVTYGIPVGIGLHLIGVPNALLWGLLATLLRFIPFLGPWIAATFPIALAFAVDPGWSKVLMTVGLFIVMELISNNLVEPWLYGAGTGVSVVAVIGGAIFWTWLWGGIGLFLAMPLTTCVVVMGKYVPGLSIFHDLFGSEPVLQPHLRLYQRMLAMDSEEMLRLAEEYLENADLTAFYDQVMIPALILAEEDRQSGSLAEVRHQFIIRSSRELMEDLSERAPAAPSRLEGRVLCFPASDDADETVALMLVQLLRAEGVAAEVISAVLQPSQCDQLLRSGEVRVAVISALPPSALAPARRLCRRLKETCGALEVLIGIWTPQQASHELLQRVASARPAGVVTTLKAAVQQLATDRETAPVKAPAKKIAPPVATVPAGEPEDFLADIKRELARLFQVPLAFVALVKMDQNFWKPLNGRGEEEDPAGFLRDSAVCAHLTDSIEPVVVEDVGRDRRLAEDSFLHGRGIQSYIAWPLRTRTGHPVGTLCVLDTKTRTFDRELLQNMEDVVKSLMRTLEGRSPRQAH